MGLGMGEVVLILVIALVVFGPRKLPELGKSLGQAMSQFRRASEDRFFLLIESRDPLFEAVEAAQFLARLEPHAVQEVRA